MKSIGVMFFLLLISVQAISSEVETPEMLSSKIEAELSDGDEKEKIEAFMSGENWVFTYDRFQSRYQARTQEGKSKCKHFNLLLWLFYDCSVQIYINVDSNYRYSSHDVEQIFSGL